MKKIKAYTSYHERTNTRRYRMFKVLESLPELGAGGYGYAVDKDIIELSDVKLDCEQGNNEVYNYNFYEVKYRYLDDEDYEDDEFDIDYICVENDEIEY